MKFNENIKSCKIKELNVDKLYKNLPTGQYDVNWQLIFEGDKVIDEYGYKYKVVYSTEYACWLLQDIKDGIEKPLAFDGLNHYASLQLKIYSKNKNARKKFNLE